MTVTATDQIDFLWKKIVFGVTKTDSETAKAGSNETIASPLPVYAHDIWAKADQIPTTPPAADTGLVKVYFGAQRIQCVLDATSAPYRTWLTNLKDFIPPTFGAAYAVEVFIGDPNGSRAARILPGVPNEEWIFDYQAGVLHFPSGEPGTKTATIGTGSVTLATAGIFIRAYRYIGAKGIASAVPLYDETAFTYTGATQTGTYTLTNYFPVDPVDETAVVYFNGAKLNPADYSTNGRDLTLNLGTIGYDLEDTDVIGATFGYLV